VSWSGEHEAAAGQQHECSRRKKRRSFDGVDGNGSGGSRPATREAAARQQASRQHAAAQDRRSFEPSTGVNGNGGGG